MGMLLRRYYADQQEANTPAPPEFSSGAASALKEAGIAESDYDGLATGKSGVVKGDVVAWLEARGDAE